MKNLLSATSYALQELNTVENPAECLSSITAILGSGAKADRCYIFQLYQENEEWYLRQLNEWVKDQISAQINNPELQGIPVNEMPGVVEELRNGKLLNGLVKDSPYHLFRELMESQDIQAYLFAPILVNKELWGFIGFDKCSRPQIWDIDEANAIQAVAHTIAMRMQYFQTLKQKETLLERFELSSDGSGVGVWELDTKTGDTHLSRTGHHLFGYEPKSPEFSLEKWADSIHPDDKERVLGELQLLLNNEVESQSSTYRFRTADGTYIWIESKAFFRDKEKRILIGTHIDVSQFIKQEQIIADQHDFLERITNNIHDMVCVVDDDCKFTFVSPSSRFVSGFNPTELLGTKFSSYLHPEKKNKVIKSLENVKEKHESITLEFKMRTRSGSYQWMEGIFSHVGNGNNHGWAIQTSIRNIEDRKQAEDEITRSLEREMELNDLKSKFVSMASHQFRTPLAVMHSNAELIDILITKEEIDKEKIKRITTTLKREIFRITELMENILIFGKGEINVNLAAHPLNLLEQISHTLDTYFAQEMKDRPCKIHFKKEELPFYIIADEILLTHLLINIVSNAYKYSSGSKAPEIRITQKEKENFATVKIIDFGIGIPEDEKQKLFESFFRASNTTTYKGSGLGLVLCREFIEKMGGTISIDSELNKGTQVTIHIPLWVDKAEAELPN